MEQLQLFDGPTPPNPNDLDYVKLRAVLKAAYDQASKGKGRERHANDLPFHDQPMQRVSRVLQSTDGMAFQAIKKIKEAKGMDTSAAIRELLGAIVYTAGIIIYLEQEAGYYDDHA